jgi:chaperonin GroES
MKFRPLFDRIIVKKLGMESAQGIIVPEKVPSGLAVVVACGEGSRFSDGTLCPVKVKVGQKVLLEDGAGIEMEIGMQKFHRIREHDIIGVFDEAAPDLKVVGV